MITLQLTEIIILVQIPIVLSLYIMGIQASRILEVREFKLISIGWLINLFYLIIKYFITNENASLLFTTISDLASSLFFLLATVSTLQWFNKTKRINEYYWIIIFIVGAVIKLIPRNPETDIIPYILVRRIPSAFLDAFALYSLALFFNKLTKRFQQSKVLYIATLFYALIQFLDLLQRDSLNKQSFIYINIDAIGFTLGLFFKFIILISLSIFLINVVKHLTGIEKELNTKKAFAEKLNQIIGRTFHEISPPILEIKTVISGLTSDNDVRDPDITLSKKARREIEKAENATNRIRTILSASNKMYISDVLPLDPETEAFTLPIPIDEEIGKHNINTLIEIAMMNFKTRVFHDLAKNYFVTDKIRFQMEYGGKCSIYCNSVEVVQIFYNLFKNSYEAYYNPSKDNENKVFKNGVCEIFVKSKNDIVEGSVEKGKIEKHIKIEIEDNGPGIPKEISSKVFDQGFSTKQYTKRGRGFGLNIVKNFTEKNNGIVTIESPILNSHISDKNINGGTKFTIIFPKIK